jgi:hypothetical protein
VARPHLDTLDSRFSRRERTMNDDLTTPHTHYNIVLIIITVPFAICSVDDPVILKHSLL